MSDEQRQTANQNRESSNWSEANQEYLLGHLARLRDLLLDHSQRQQDTPVHQKSDAAGSDDRPISVMTHEQPAGLDTICSLFGLSPFERDILILCAGVELDAEFAPLCAAAQGAELCIYPTWGLALAALPDAHWSALTPDAPLRYWQLIHMEAGQSLTRNPLRLDERILHYLAGISHLDEQINSLVNPVAVPEGLVASHQATADEIATTWLMATGAEGLPAVQLCGPETASKRSIAALVAYQLGLTLYSMPLTAIPHAPVELERLLRLWQRESILSEGALLIDCEAGESADASREAALTQFVEAGFRGPLFLSSRERRGPWQRPVLTVDVEKPTTDEQRGIWYDILDVGLPEGAASLNGQVDRLVGQFSLSASVIWAAYQGAQGKLASQLDDAQTVADSPSAYQVGEALWNVCRRQARPQLDNLAHRIDATASWDDLILPEREQQVLREIGMHVRQRSRVYQQWGFESKGKRGLGISALFAGPSGTGKTMAAEVLAQELQLDLYRIDLSAVVSKYIGETEKNLRRVFDAADAGGAILLFDEADALFGKRSDVKDSHDRHANIEVSYLLQRMEAYRGLAILTTNLKDSLDSAFLRRIRFVVQFPFPNAEQRAEIWRRIFPTATPTANLDVDKLARLNIAGGNIRNIALHAAFLAADDHAEANQDGAAEDEEAAGEEVSVGMSHLVVAARREYAKLERSLPEAEIRGWV